MPTMVEFECHNCNKKTTFTYTSNGHRWIGAWSGEYQIPNHPHKTTMVRFVYQTGPSNLPDADLGSITVSNPSQPNPGSTSVQYEIVTGVGSGNPMANNQPFDGQNSQNFSVDVPASVEQEGVVMQSQIQAQPQPFVYQNNEVIIQPTYPTSPAYSYPQGEVIYIEGQNPLPQHSYPIIQNQQPVEWVVPQGQFPIESGQVIYQSQPGISYPVNMAPMMEQAIPGYPINQTYQGEIITYPSYPSYPSSSEVIIESSTIVPMNPVISQPVPAQQVMPGVEIISAPVEQATGQPTPQPATPQPATPNTP
jgi:hypothetical protein